MTAASQMGSWKAVVLCHELKYDLTKYAYNKKIVFSMVKNTFAFLGFNIDVTFLILWGLLLCMIYTSL